MKYLGSLFGFILAVSYFGGASYIREIRSMIAVAGTRSTQLASNSEVANPVNSSQQLPNLNAAPSTTPAVSTNSKIGTKKHPKILPPPAVTFDSSLTYLYFGKGQMREYTGVELITKPKLRKRLQKTGYFMVKNGTDLSYPPVQTTTIVTEKPISETNRNPSGSNKSGDSKPRDNVNTKLMDRFEKKIYTGQ